MALQLADVKGDDSSAVKYSDPFNCFDMDLAGLVVSIRISPDSRK